ncbi:hypothetical protein D910_10445 [Dendroctonus ponderosae]
MADPANSSPPLISEAGSPEGHEQQKSWAQQLKKRVLPGVRITLLISLIFYIAMFAIGIWGVHRCPVEENIPFFLIVAGGIGLFSKIMSVIREAISTSFPIQYVESSLYTVELVFIFFGSFWVFKEYKPSFSPSDQDRYCNKTVYLFAFSFLVVLYAILATMVICFFCFLACIFFVKETERDHRDPESPPFHGSSSTTDQQT